MSWWLCPADLCARRTRIRATVGATDASHALRVLGSAPAILSLCGPYVRPILSQQRSQSSAARLPARPYHSPKGTSGPAGGRSAAVYAAGTARNSTSARSMAWHGVAWHGMAWPLTPINRPVLSTVRATENSEAISYQGGALPVARGRIGPHEAAR